MVSSFVWYHNLSLNLKVKTLKIQGYETQSDKLSCSSVVIILNATNNNINMNNIGCVTVLSRKKMHISTERKRERANNNT